MIFEVLKFDEKGRTTPAGLLVGGHDVCDAWKTLEHLGVQRGTRTLRCADGSAIFPWLESETLAI